MFKRRTSEEYLELYKDLPLKNQELVWEEDITDRKNKLVKDFNLGEIYDEEIDIVILHLLLGILPPSQIKMVIEKEITLGEKFVDEFIQYIVLPIQHLLEEIYNKEEFSKIGNWLTEEEQENHERPSFKDPYREPIE